MKVLLAMLISAAIISAFWFLYLDNDYLRSNSAEVILEDSINSMFKGENSVERYQRKFGEDSL
jgi:hypothetical protein